MESSQLSFTYDNFLAMLPINGSISSKKIYQWVYNALLPTLAQPSECQAIAHRLLDHYCQLSTLHLVMDTQVKLSVYHYKKLCAAIQRLKQHEPVQYVLQTAPFLGRNFYVDSSVLIPRPTTEELVQHILNEGSRSGNYILDIGTGSGCIAITLQQELSGTRVYALDEDADALRIAKMNAQRMGAELRFVQADILKDVVLPDQSWDIIVSNPPYVLPSERVLMHPNVLNYEPKKALFVPERDPLCFYERIMAFAAQRLVRCGRLYLEINATFADKLMQLGEMYGLKRIRVWKDLHAQDRWLTAIRTA